MEKNIRFESNIQALEKINPLFSRAKVRVLYAGANRNGSYFSKEVVDETVKKGLLYNIPIVGEFIEETNNFGDHGVSIEIKNDDIKFITSTKPYGVIPESAKVYWEDVTETNGDINSYLVVDGAYLWTGRYEELSNLLEQPYGQSMEIEVINGNFAIIDGVETFKVDEFLFSALCILGVDKDGEGYVEPAFESASIMAYSLDKENFKKQFNQMMAELKFSMKNELQEGGNNMDLENKDVEQEVVEEEVKKDEVADEKEITSEADLGSDNGNKEDDDKDSTKEEEALETDSDESGDTQKDEEKEETVLKSEYDKVVDSHEKLSKEFVSLQSELEELKSYKRQREESDLRNQFNSQVSEEEFTQIFTEMKDSSIEEIEIKLFALVGKKNFSLKKETKSEVNKVEILDKTEETEESPYGDLFN